MALQAPTGMLVEAPARESGSAAWLRRRLSALAAVLVDALGPGEKKHELAPPSPSPLAVVLVEAPALEKRSAARHQPRV